jgi:hypothetical protein
MKIVMDKANFAKMSKLGQMLFKRISMVAVNGVSSRWDSSSDSACPEIIADGPSRKA